MRERGRERREECLIMFIIVHMLDGVYVEGWKESQKFSIILCFLLLSLTLYIVYILEFFLSLRLGFCIASIAVLIRLAFLSISSFSIVSLSLFLARALFRFLLL